MNALDWMVLLGTMLGIAGYGIWRTRGHRNLDAYLKGKGDTRWLVIGLSVMATQASAITFLSTPGQGYESGLGFVQNYFGAPLALIVICVVFLPIYRRLKVFTAYEYLGQRFDSKTRLLGASLFLLQRGLGAGITIYAPAIVLSTVMGWRLDLTIICSGVLVIIYTVAGGSDAVSHTQKYQFTVIFAGMLAAFITLLHKLPGELRFTDALSIAGGFHKLQAVDFSLSPNRRYTIWSGLLGGMFLALSYFGTDQSQVQRYISGASLRESRMGLMFNAVCKIPMQFFILMLGVMLFVFYQFEQPPLFFNQTAWKLAVQHDPDQHLQSLADQFSTAHAAKEQIVQRWIDARHTGDAKTEATARSDALAAESSSIRFGRMPSRPWRRYRRAPREMTRIMSSSPSSSSICPTVDRSARRRLFCRGTLVEGGGTECAGVDDDDRCLSPSGRQTTRADAHYVHASKCFTMFWGFVAIGLRSLPTWSKI